MIQFFQFAYIQNESSTSVTLKATAAFDEINKRVKAEPTLAKKIGAVILFDITKDGQIQQSWSKKMIDFLSMFDHDDLFQPLMVNKVRSIKVNQKKELPLK